MSVATNIYHSHNVLIVIELNMRLFTIASVLMIAQLAVAVGKN